MTNWDAKTTRRANHSIPVQPCLEKISAFLFAKITPIAASSRSSEGRLAIVTDAGRDAVDAAASSREVNAGQAFD
jgi:hypothetical protein